MNKTSLLELTKIWIYPAETVWKQKKSLKKPSKISSKGTRRLEISSDTLVCVVCLDELRKQQIIDQKVYD